LDQSESGKTVSEFDEKDLFDELEKREFSTVPYLKKYNSYLIEAYWYPTLFNRS